MPESTTRESKGVITALITDNTLFTEFLRNVPKLVYKLET